MTCSRQLFVAHAVAQGHTVIPRVMAQYRTEQDAARWDDYLEQGVMRAIDVPSDQSRRPINT